MLRSSAGVFVSKRNCRRRKASRNRTRRFAAREIERLELRAMLAASALYPAVTLDPVDRLATSRILGEWATDGNFDGWIVNNAASSSVAGGTLTVTSQNGTSNATQIDL